jgi:hypothetical protein
MTDSALQALSILRNPATFQWYIVPLFALIVYVYSAEVERRNWSLVFAGLAFWGMDWFNEIWNALVFKFTGYAPVWGAPGKTAFLLLIGLNIEICFMFAIAGIGFGKMLPADKNQKILGLPNRLFFALTGAAFCTIVEIFLNAAGALTWEYPWWSARAPWLVFLVGYLPFFLVSFYVFDLETLKKKLTVTGSILAFDAACLLVFGTLLHWI